MYYGAVGGCGRGVLKRDGYRFRSVMVVAGRGEVWVADGDRTILVVNYNTSAVTTITMPTGDVHSLLDMTTRNLIGVCTSLAFYILTYTGTIQYTQPSPTAHTRHCTLSPAYSGTPSEFLLTAVPESRRYLSSSTSIYPLWSILKI